MADFDINIQTRFQSLQDLYRMLEETQKLLTRMGQGHELKNFSKQLEKSADPLKLYSDRISSLVKEYKEIQELITVAKQEGDKKSLSELRAQARQIRTEMANVIATGQVSPALKAQESAIKTQYAWHNISKSVKSAGQALGQFARWSQNIVKSTKKSSTWIDRLWGRIRNISIYKMIRTGIKWVTSGFREGLQNFAQYNGEVNSTVSELNANLKQIRNTMGISLAYTLQSLQPLIESVLNGITEGLNAFNLALAKMQGKDQFTKAKKNVEDYSKSLEKAKKLSFDTFEALNSGDSATSPQNMFEQANIDENESKLSRFFERIFAFIQNVGDAIGRIFERLSKTDIFDKLLTIAENIANAISGVIIELLDSGALDTILNVITEIWKVFSVIIKATASFVSYLNQIGALKPILYGIAAAWVAIKIAAIGAAIASAAAWVAQHPITGSIIIAGAITTATLIAKNALERQTAGYAEGGIPAKSELFYMNENGVPEALVNTGGSQTNVINIDQLSEGMRRGFVQAIYDTGLLNAMQQGSSTIVVDKDVLGRTVAESAGFRNEVNRRNVSLNLR